MSRPCKRRRVCAMPGCGRFGPVEGNAEQRVIMSVDEFEAIRLIDYEGLTQEACAERMHAPLRRQSMLRHGANLRSAWWREWSL